MKRWRPQLIALVILLAFIGFSYSYVRYFVRARTHAVIVFLVPGASQELLALAQTRHPNRSLPGLDQADALAFVETHAADQLTGDAAALASFLATAQDILSEFWTKAGYTHAPCPVLRLEKGTRYAAIYRDEYRNGTLVSGSIHAFVDLKGGPHKGTINKPGDILKPASYKAPAKHARGNIFDADHGASAVGPYGVAYLK